MLLDGSASYDDNLDVLTHFWSFVARPAGSSATLVGQSEVTASFEADVSGSYVVGLIVNDGIVNSGSDNATIVATYSSSQAIGATTDIIDIVNAQPKSVFKNRNMANALTNKLNAVLKMIDAGDYSLAREKLVDDVMKRTDGCATSGMPDKNDWIEDCESQESVYSAAQYTLEVLDSLIGG